MTTFSSTPDMNILAESERAVDQEVDYVAYHVFGLKEGWILGMVRFNRAYSSYAENRVLWWLENKYPPCQGYARHSVSTRVINSTQLDLVERKR